MTELSVLITEAEWITDRWLRRIGKMIRRHHRQTGHWPNAIWLPKRFARLATRVSIGLRDGEGNKIPGKVYPMLLPPEIRGNYRIMGNDDLIPPLDRCVLPEDLVVGRVEEKRTHDGSWSTTLNIHTFFVERLDGRQGKR